MTTLALLFLGVLVVIALVYALGARHGVSPRARTGEPPWIELEDDPEPGSFRTDFGPKRERPPTDADGPGWDS